MYKNVILSIICIVFLNLLVISCSKDNGVNTSTVTPKISNFSPKKGEVESTVTISGDNFSADSSEEIVKIGGIKAAMISANMKQIKVIVPSNLDPALYVVSVTIEGMRTTASKNFKVIDLTPRIYSISPKSGSVGTIATIKGARFSATISENMVKFGNETAEIVSATTTQLKVKVPKRVMVGTAVPVNVLVSGRKATASKQFNVVSTAPKINSVVPATAVAGSEVSIIGANFSTTKSKNKVMFGSKVAKVDSSKSDHLFVTVPSGLKPGTIHIKVSVSGKNEEAIAPGVFKYFIKLVPTSIQKGQIWNYTTETQSNEKWTGSGFDDSKWKSGPAGFGSPFPHRRTDWETSDIYLRKEFSISNLKAVKSGILSFKMLHDEDTQIYINGTQVLSVSGFITTYKTFNFDTSSKKALHEGVNIIAVHTHQTFGGQFIDVGLFDK